MTPSGRRVGLVVYLLAGGGVLFALTQTMIVPLLEPIGLSTGAALSELSWMVTTPLVVAASLAPLLGRLADIRGKKTVLVIVLAAMVAGGVLVAVSTSPGATIAGRALQGFGGAFIPISVALLRDLVAGRQFVRGVALLSSSLGLGVAAGVPLASMIAGVAGWRIAFLVVALLTAAVLAGVVLGVRESGGRGSAEPLDVVGGVTLALLLALLMVAVSGAGEWGLLDPRTIAAAAIVAVGGAAWVLAELRSRSPIVDLRLASRPSVALANAIAFFAGYALFANVLVTTRLVQNPVETGRGFGLSVAEAGLFIAPAGLTMLVCSQLARLLIGRWGARASIIVGGIVMSIGYGIQLGEPTLVGALVALVVVSAGLSLPYAGLPVLVTQAVRLNATGSANAINVLARNVGQAVCSAVVGALSVGLVVRVGGMAFAAPSALALSFAAALVASLVATVLGVLLPRDHGS